MNQVLEILLKFLETRDWKTSFFQVIPQRKRCQADLENNGEDKVEGDNEPKDEQLASKREKVEDL